MNPILSTIIILSVMWFLLYWLFGGVFFSIIAFARLGRIKKARFGCLFTLASLGTAVFAAWAGLRLGRKSIVACYQGGQGVLLNHLERFSCGIVEIFGMFFVGTALLLVLGFAFMALSRQSAPVWMERVEPVEDEEVDEEE